MTRSNLYGAPPSVDVTFADLPFTFTVAGSSTTPARVRTTQGVKGGWST